MDDGDACLLRERWLGDSPPSNEPQDMNSRSSKIPACPRKRSEPKLPTLLSAHTAMHQTTGTEAGASFQTTPPFPWADTPRTGESCCCSLSVPLCANIADIIRARCCLFSLLGSMRPGSRARAVHKSSKQAVPNAQTPPATAKLSRPPMLQTKYLDMQQFEAARGCSAEHVDWDNRTLAIVAALDDLTRASPSSS